PPELSRRGGEGRLEAPAGVVPEVRRGLTPRGRTPRSVAGEHGGAARVKHPVASDADAGHGGPSVGPARSAARGRPARAPPLPVRRTGCIDDARQFAAAIEGD